LFTFPWAAPAQTYEFSVFGSRIGANGKPLGSLSGNRPRDDDSRLRAGYGYGARVTWNTPGYYGHELTYIHSRPTFETKLVSEDGRTVTPAEAKIQMQQAAYNFMMYMMPLGERFRPFITVGLEAHQYGAPRIEGFPGGNSRHYGGNFGGGLKIKLSRNALIRFDVRDYIAGKPYDLNFVDPGRSEGFIRHLETSFGFAIAF